MPYFHDSMHEAYDDNPRKLKANIFSLSIEVE